MSMDSSQAIDLCRQALLLAAMLAAPILIVGALMGVITGLLQTLFQIQDQSISFVPKLIVSSIVLLACMPWMLSRIIQFTHTLLTGTVM